MRKLLVASQKGGVGKTTTSMNLAAAAAGGGGRVLLLDADPLSSVSVSLNLSAHAERQSLQQIGLDLPGALVHNVVPGVDVLCPYDEGLCTDDDFDTIVKIVTTTTFRDNYTCLLVDAPPFLGANPKQLVGICDEFILVMRAEPMAYRTLPAFLELVQRNRGNGNGKGIQMRGILLTLNEGENRGERWERELRGRFGSRILSRVILYDGEVAQATLFGRILSHANPEAEVSREYSGLADELTLVEGGRAGKTSVVALLQTAGRGMVPQRQAVTPVTAPERASDEMAVANETRRTPSTTRTTSSAAVLDVQESGESPYREPEPEPIAETPREKLPQIPRRPATPPRRSGMVRPAPVEQEPEPIDEAEKPVALSAPTPAQPRRKPAPRPAPATGQWIFPVFLAGIAGFGLGALRQPALMLPVLVGVLVAGVVVMLLRRSPTTPPKPQPKPQRRPASSGRLSKAVRRPASVRRKPMDR